MANISIRGVSLFVKVIGKGYPIVLMHGGPSADMYTLMAYRPCAKNFTLVFYDHRCNGRSVGADVTTMNMENLTADAEALRQALGFDKWAVLGHSFGGYVAMEYALRYPNSLSHLLLVDTGADNRLAQEQAPEILAQRGFDSETVNLARQFLNGQFKPNEMFNDLMKLGKAYNPFTTLAQAPSMIFWGLHTKLRPEAAIYSQTHYLRGWSVKTRLGEIKVPTLVMAGREDFIYPPDSQEELAAAIPNSRLVLFDRAGHNVHDECPKEVIRAVMDFMTST